MAIRFKIGAVVVKVGTTSPEMTVISDQQGLVEVQWFTENDEWRESLISQDSLLLSKRER